MDISGNIEVKKAPKINQGGNQLLKTISNQKYLLLMSVPVIIWLIIFYYIPIWGWTMAVQDYVPGLPFFKQQFVGMDNFIELFKDERFYLALQNTVIMSGLQLIFSCFVLPILFALFLNEVRIMWFKRSIQTISYLPHFVSWVIVAGLFITMLSTDGGVVNDILTKTGLLDEKIQFMAEPKYFYAIITIADGWKEIGWNAIIYIAAISSIDLELYEAAGADGAGRFKKMWHITLPGIRSTIVVLIIMNIGMIMGNGFEKQFLFNNALVTEKAEVLDMYALSYGLELQRYSFGTTVGIFKSVVALVLMFTTNFIFKRTTKEGLV